MLEPKKGIAKYLGLGIDVLKDDGSRPYNHWKSKHIFDNSIFDEEWGDTLTTLDDINKITIGNPSFNIIDLIKVGAVIALKEGIDKFAQIFILGIYEPALLKEIKAKIKSDKSILELIVTKEQFEEMSCKVSD